MHPGGFLEKGHSPRSSDSDSVIPPWGAMVVFVPVPLLSGVLVVIAACWILTGMDLEALLTWFMRASFLERPLLRTPALGLGFQGLEQQFLTHGSRPLLGGG